MNATLEIYLREEDYFEFKASLGYIERPYYKHDPQSYLKILMIHYLITYYIVSEMKRVSSITKVNYKQIFLNSTWTHTCCWAGETAP